jgi:hypothetical protein
MSLFDILPTAGMPTAATKSAAVFAAARLQRPLCSPADSER